MADLLSRYIPVCAFLASGAVYVHAIEPRSVSRTKTFAAALIFFLLCVVSEHVLPHKNIWAEFGMSAAGFFLLVFMIYRGRKVSRAAAVYYAVWAFCSWQLIFEWCMAFRNMGDGGQFPAWAAELLLYGVGYGAAAFTLGKAIPDKGRKNVGPRQLLLALLTFANFQIVALAPGELEYSVYNLRWVVVYVVQVQLCTVLYLQHELFNKGELRKELEIMELLRKKEEEQYQMSKENIAFINQRAHDLKHQIRAMRNASEKEREQYLDEMEDSLQMYGSIVKTGNTALDTILTEKSLYCKERGIALSCMADGSQVGFINTVDLYAMLGNALDNAIEEVEKFGEPEKRQIDVLMFRKQQFLEIQIANPMEGKLAYEDGLPVTTKGSRMVHGLGLRSIRHTLKKYDGVLTIREEDGFFMLLMLMPVPGHA